MINKCKLPQWLAFPFCWIVLAETEDRVSLGKATLEPAAAWSRAALGGGSRGGTGLSRALRALHKEDHKGQGAIVTLRGSVILL